MAFLKYSVIPNPSDEGQIKKKFPWVGERAMLIPQGWFGLVNTACEEIESAVFPDKVEKHIKYFFVTVRERKLCIFVDHAFKEANIKQLAVESLIDELPAKSKKVCHICGKEAIIDRHYLKHSDELPNCGNHEDEAVEKEEDNLKTAVQIAHNDQIKTSQKENDDQKKIINEDDKVTNADGTNALLDTVTLATLKLFDEQKLKRIIADNDTKHRDSETATKVKAQLKKLHKSGEFRTLMPIASESSFCLDELASEFPNFEDVIEMIKGIHALSSLNEIPRIPAILLLGPPGVGKTMFAESLAKRMEVTFKVVRMENQQAGAGLVGSADFWSNSKTGAVFNVLTENECGNPVIVVDEVDKAAGDSRYNPINGLYSLLEPVSAENFCDESIPDLPINASKITWILTANDIKWIPSPILSRVCIFEIPAPDQNQAMQVARRIYTNLRISSKVLTDKFEDELEDVVANILAKLSPRQMRIGIEIAFGKAALAKRNKLTKDDIDVVEVEKKMKIGFI